MRKGKITLNSVFRESLFFFSAKDKPNDEIFKRPSLIKNKIYKQIEKIASTEATVLITGESGVGKELIAYEIHKKSGRANDLFFLINPSTIPHALFESTIYGHEKGAFTGADYLQKGIFELAHGGTVFLDEIGDVSPEMQLKLLGTIETRSFRRVGIGPVVNTHFQLICATNRDLLAAVDSGTFRADLYYRMSRIPIYIPPIRDYPEDIETLARNFLNLYANKHGKRTIPYDGKLKERMEKYRWPGNVRELEGYIERIVVLDDETLEIDAQDNRSSSDKKMKNAEKRSRVIDSLIKANWNKRKAALILGCCTRTVYNWMEEYEIPLKKQLGYYG